MPIDAWKVPVAVSMLRVIPTLREDLYFKFSRFVACWMAFNNIYSKLAEGGPNAPKPKTGFDHYGAIQIPKVKPGTEWKQIVAAVQSLQPHEMDAIIDCDETRLFLNRAPELRYIDVARMGPPPNMNGVLNVTYSLATGRYVWSPIDPALYAAHIAAPTAALRMELIEHISLMLYTVRNNTFHGGKEVEDINADNVLDHGYRLLRKIVDYHLPPAAYL